MPESKPNLISFLDFIGLFILLNEFGDLKLEEITFFNQEKLSHDDFYDFHRFHFY